MDLTTLRYVDNLLDQELKLVCSLRETVDFINTEGGLMIATLQLKAMMSRVEIITQMVQCRVTALGQTQAACEDSDAVQAKLEHLMKLMQECRDTLEERALYLRDKSRRLMETVG